MNPLTEAVSSALLQFVWQGLVVASLLWVAFSFMRGCSANARYVASCAALVVQAASPIITALLLYARPPLAELSRDPHGLPVGLAFVLPKTSVDWQSWALSLWSAGVLIFSIRFAWGYFHVAALGKNGTTADEGLCATVTGLAVKMDLARPVRVLMGSLLDGPSVIGWIRPIILVPAATVAGLTPEHLEMVLAHELAHIRRFDYLVNLGQMLVETLLFYHPAVWWISGRIRHERELCCDDIAVRVCGNPISYARALTALEKLRSGAPLIAMGAASKPLLYRIQRLTGTGTQDIPRQWAGVMAICATLVCLALNMNWARGQAQIPSPKPVTPSVSLPAPPAKTPRAAKKKVQAPAPKSREENPWISQIMIQKPEPSKPDPLPSELRSALNAVEYAAGWEYGYLQFTSPADNEQAKATRAEMKKIAALSDDISKALSRLEKEATNASSPEAREKIVVALRALVDDLRQNNERLRAARHDDGETRDPPPRVN